MEKRLYVGNLSYNTTEDDIEALFRQAGDVVSCQLMLDKFTSRSRGFAFVEMGTHEEAESAVTMFNEQDFQGRSLRVNLARPREERPVRRDGGGGRSGGYSGRNSGGGRERGSYGGGGGRSGGYRERDRY